MADAVRGSHLSRGQENREHARSPAAKQKAGKTRFKGLSTHRILAMQPLLARRHFDVILAPYNFTKGKFAYIPSVDVKAIEGCHEDGLGGVAMKVMAGGALRRLTSPPSASAPRDVPRGKPD